MTQIPSVSEASGSAYQPFLYAVMSLLEKETSFRETSTIFVVKILKAQHQN